MDSHLLSLYATVLVPILSEWITGEDVCYFDSAVCSKQNRKYLLRLMTQCIVYADVSYTDQVVSSLQSWLLLRGLRLKTYNTSWKLLTESNLISNRLAILDCHCGKTILNLFQPKSIPFDVVNLVYLGEYELAGLIGHKITDLRLVYTYASHVKIALSCPNLRSISLGFRGDALPYIKHCNNLDTVYNCQLKSLLLRQHPDLNFDCDLKRTTVIDESAVCLGEGKYFHLTGLHTFQVRIEDNLLLTPLVKNLRSLNLFEDRPILKTVIDKQVNLTKVVILNAHLHLSDYCTLLQQSPSLTALTLTTMINKPIMNKVDTLLEVAANCCPLLTTVVLYDVTMLESSLMSFLQKTKLVKLEICNSYVKDGELVVTVNPRNGSKKLQVGADADMQWVRVVKNHYEFGK